jgi:malonyl CoA-acyl carrier protein transacylase
MKKSEKTKPKKSTENKEKIIRKEVDWRDTVNNSIKKVVNIIIKMEKEIEDIKEKLKQVTGRMGL